MFDKESGLYYYNARYYDANAGIFITPDPAMSGLNHYAYCSANPINYIDPTGCWEWTPNHIIGLVDVIVGAVLAVIAIVCACLPYGVGLGATAVCGALAVSFIGCGVGLLCSNDAKMNLEFSVSVGGGGSDDTKRTSGTTSNTNNNNNNDNDTGTDNNEKPVNTSSGDSNVTAKEVESNVTQSSNEGDTQELKDISVNEIVNEGTISSSFSDHQLREPTKDYTWGVDITKGYMAEETTPYKGELYFKYDSKAGFQALVVIGHETYFTIEHQALEGKFYDYYSANVNKMDAYGRVYYGKVNAGDLIGYMGYSGNCHPKGIAGTHAHAAVLTGWSHGIDPRISQ